MDNKELKREKEISVLDITPEQQEYVIKHFIPRAMKNESSGK